MISEGKLIDIPTDLLGREAEAVADDAALALARELRRGARGIRSAPDIGFWNTLKRAGHRWIYN